MESTGLRRQASIWALQGRLSFMWPATAWDDREWEGVNARGWTVMGQLRSKQLSLQNAKRLAQQRTRQDPDTMSLMSAISITQDYRDQLARTWRGSYTLLAFLFAPPDEPAIDLLNQRGQYFDIRTGDTWDLFFPGYYRSRNRRLESEVHANSPFSTPLPIGDKYTSNWYFSAADFNELRHHIEVNSSRCWQYSGGSDLVLLNAYVPNCGDPIVDWASAQSGAITPPNTLATAIEQISRDIQNGEEDAAYGVAPITNANGPENDTARTNVAQDFAVQALAGIATALGLKAAGS